MILPDFTPADLRHAAPRFATEDATEHLGVAPLPKRALAAIIEQAFSEAPPRGLTYREELDELCEWLSKWATVDMDALDHTTRLLACVAASIGDHWNGDSRERSIAEHRVREPELVPLAEARIPLDRRCDQALLDLVRAVAIYFLRTEAETMADLLRDEEIVGKERAFGSEGGAS